MKSFAIAVALSSALVSSSSIYLGISIEEEATMEDSPQDLMNQHYFTHSIEHQSMPGLGHSDDRIDLGYEIHQGYWTGHGKYINFNNVPYAEPPIGKMRWVNPTNVQNRRKEVNTGADRTVCPQTEPGWIPAATSFVKDLLLKGVLPKKWKNHIHPGNYADFGPGKGLHADSSEDCLNLDVVVPRSIWESRNDDGSKKAAVLVYIHGGGFVYGWKDAFGSPEGLLETASLDGDDIIYVTMNYRLGAFGWLGGDRFYSDGGLANLGLQDQLFALEWVKEHIASFGGDPDRKVVPQLSITLMGESAGAASILHHITANSNLPAFKSAIVQSPGFFPQPNQTREDETYETFLNLTGTKSLDELWEADSHVLMRANADMTYNSSYGLFAFGPTIDGYYVTDLPCKDLKEGRLHTNINLLAGHTKFDGVVFTPPWVRSNAQLEDHVREMFPGVPDFVLEDISEMYPVGKISYGKQKILKVSDFLDDVAIQCNTQYLTKAMLGTSKVYRYAFNIIPAIHGADLAYTFANSTSKVNQRVAKFWQSSIANFVRSGDPNNENSPRWPLYNIDEPELMNVGSASQWLLPNYRVSVGKDTLDREKCDYWQSAPYYAPENSFLQQMGY